MAKFKLAADKTILVSGVLKSLKAGEHETTDKAEVEALQGAKDVEEVKAKTAKSKAAE